MKKLALIMLVVGGLVTGLAGGVASADSSLAVCGFSPGTIHSLYARDGAPIAGPNSTTSWGAAPDAPNTPGQAVVNVCVN
jgi:hypothetical protein